MWTANSGQTGQMKELIWFFAEHICCHVGFVMLLLYLNIHCDSQLEDAANESHDNSAIFVSGS